MQKKFLLSQRKTSRERLRNHEEEIYRRDELELELEQ
jgi:hypothetical protein